MPEPISVKDVRGRKASAYVSRFGGFPDRSICGLRDEWQPGILHVVSFQDSEPHHHDDMEEIFLILDGAGKVTIGGSEVEVGRWDTVRIPRFVEHSAEPNPGERLVIAVYFDRCDRESKDS